MLNWIGFNYGIGFHALQTSGYYRYLGKSKSSHGCVRVSREIAEYLYNRVNLGTPVLVHTGKAAITIEFGNIDQINCALFKSNKLKKEIQDDLNLLYSGKFVLKKKYRLFVDRENVNHSGLPIGDFSKILMYQMEKPIYNFIGSSIPSHKTLMIIETKLSEYKFVLN